MKINKKRKNLVLRTLLTITVLMPMTLAPTRSFPQDRNLNAVEIFQPLNDASLLKQKSAAAANTSYSIRVRFDELQKLEAGQDVRLQYSATEQWEGRIQRVERRSNESFTLFGKIDGPHEGWFIFTIEGDVIVGSIQIPEMNLLADLRNIQDDSFWLYFFDSKKSHEFKSGVAAERDNQDSVLTSLAEPVTNLAEPVTSLAEPVTNLAEPVVTFAGEAPLPQHDIMVLYTEGLLNDFPNHFPNTPLETAIQHLVDYANQCYINSGVQLRLRLVYRAMLPGFSEAGRDRDWLLAKLAGKDDGYLDYIHNWRTLFHADLVCLMYSYDMQGLNDGGGLAYVLDEVTFNAGNPAEWYNNSGGFCVVEGLWKPSTMEPPLSGMVPYEFVHEIGHTQGLTHNCEDGGGRVRSFAYGWRFIGDSGTKYATIMAYGTNDYSFLPNFSNPLVFFDGEPTGNATTAGCSGTTGARNAEALNLTADFVSRMHLNPLDPWVDFNYTGTTQNGRFETPWKTLESAINNLPQTTAVHTPEPPTITFKGPTSSGPLSITINKRLTLKASSGAVTIGRAL